MNALGDAHLKCCLRMYFSLALITKGSVRTLVRSIVESNGESGRRPKHSRCAPDTQNRQYALMTEDHDACETLVRSRGRFRIRLESLRAGCRRMGTRFWNCVGRCSQVHSDDEHDTDFSQEQFAVGYVYQQCRSSSRLVAMMLFIPKLWSESDRGSWKCNERR